jgi:antitoxin component YwqK of YwqJK toxin-antitoxin module
MGEVRLAVRRVEYDDGGWYEGSLDANGDEHGHGTEFYGNGNAQFQGHWKNGAREGYGTEFYEDGNPRYQGRWKNGVREGYGTELYEDGIKLKFVGLWKNGEYDFDHSRTFYSRDGRKLEFHRQSDANGTLRASETWGSDMCTIYRSGPT